MLETISWRELGQPVLLILLIGSLFHVGWESRRIGDSPLRNILMVAVCLWPLGYLFWIFYWPGTLRKWLWGARPAFRTGRHFPG